MKTEDLKRALERYYEGESTEEEERALREFFRHNDVPEEYEADKTIFSYYDRMDIIPEPSSGFENRILESIDAMKVKAGNRIKLRFMAPYLSAAATLLILVGCWFFFIHNREPEDTFKDPRIAYAETMKILLTVSTKMNHGTMALAQVNKLDAIASRSLEAVDRSTDKISQNLGSLGKKLEPLGLSGKKKDANYK
jgi:hypothetical protein